MHSITPFPVFKKRSGGARTYIQVFASARSTQPPYMGVDSSTPRTFSGKGDSSTHTKSMQAIFGNFNLKILMEQIFLNPLRFFLFGMMVVSLYGDSESCADHPQRTSAGEGACPHDAARNAATTAGSFDLASAVI